MVGELLLNTLTSKPAALAANFLLGPYVTIFMLHRPGAADGSYGGTAPELLDEALIYARDAGFEFANVDEVVGWALAGEKISKPVLCFTMDDGYQDQIDVLTPVLLKHDAKPTLYVLADMVESQQWPWDAQLTYCFWNSPLKHIEFSFEDQSFSLPLVTPQDRISRRRKMIRFAKTLDSARLSQFMQTLLPLLEVDYSQTPANFEPATWESLKTAESKGLKIGSHACSHRILSALSDEDITCELQRANQLFAQHLQDPSRVFCYPSGTQNDFKASHAPLLAAQGFIGALSSIPANTRLDRINAQPYAIPRHSFPNDMPHFIRYSSWLEYLRSKI